MSLIRIYQCFCDRTRLRILYQLQEGGLCVCHLQEVLGEPQVKISKHLAYLRARGVVESRKEANWMIYRLPERPPAELTANLACLQDCVREIPVFRRDAAKREKLHRKFAASRPLGCVPPPTKTKRQTPA